MNPTNQFCASCLFARLASTITTTVVALLLGAALMSSAVAQTVTLTPLCGFNIFAGANYSGAYTNAQIKASLSGNFSTIANPVTLSVTPVAGVTYGYSTNGFINSQNSIFLTLAVTNVAKGTYPLTITASTNGVPLATTNITLIVGNLWTNSAANASWSSGVNWSLGGVNDGDDVMFQDAGSPAPIGSSTNYVDVSRTLSSLTFIRNITTNSQNMTLAPGTVLTATNGMFVSVDSYPANSKTTTLNISGAGAALIVTNSLANAAICSDSTGNAGTTLVMTNLDTFKAYVNRFGVGDVNFAVAGGVGAQFVNAAFAKTNLINALFTSDYTVTNAIAYAVSIGNNSDLYNNGSSEIINLGMANTFQADSLGVGQSRCGGSSSVMQFAPVFTNQLPYATFRNSNGTRMSLVALAADAGTTAPGSNTKYQMNFNFGNVNMLVDTMWIGRNRYTNTSSAASQGSFTFNSGTVDVNTLRLGYQEYTNGQICKGTVTVGGWTNAALLSVNTELNLGYTAGDYSSGANSGQCFGQVVINTNGTVRANTITVGTLSTNDQITINTGGILVVTNTVASTTNYLQTLTLAGGQLTLVVQSGVTNIYATNVIVSGSPKINIASVPYAPNVAATNVIIQYAGSAPAAGLGIGTIPANFNNMSLVVDTTAKTISLVNAANAPKNLVWRGPGSVWDHSSFNWVDTNAQVTAKFTDGDRVVFDDKSGVPTSISVMETVLPSQNGVGILFTNSINNFVFTTNSATASGIEGGPVMLKTGTASVELDGYANVSAQLNQGKIIGSGIIGSLTTVTNTFLGWSGEIFSPVTIGGGATNLGVFDAGVTLSSGGALTNYGTINGQFTVNSGATLNNIGAMNSIGAASVNAGGSLVNTGTLVGNSLTVGGRFFDSGTTIELVGTLEILGGGTFIPGGSGIGTTIVKQTSNFDPTTAGTVKLDSGSTNVFKVDYGAVGQKNTEVLCNLMLLGPSQNNVKTNGGIIAITNIGVSAFAAGQTFQLFGAQPSGGTFDPSQFSLNTTNAYPVMQPLYLSVGLMWDLSQVIFNGQVTVSASPLPQTPTTLTITVSGNVVNISWLDGYTGWRLLEQTNTLNVGLGTNWFVVTGSTVTNSVSITNNPSIPTAFFQLNYPYP